jgi:hypothetical protein
LTTNEDDESDKGIQVEFKKKRYSLSGENVNINHIVSATYRSMISN